MHHCPKQNLYLSWIRLSLFSLCSELNIIEIKIDFIQFHIVGDFLSPKTISPVSLLEQSKIFNTMHLLENLV